MREFLLLGIYFIGISLFGIAAIDDDVSDGYDQGSDSVIKGIPFIHNYSPEDIGMQTQHWAILQLSSGEMVFGSSDGLQIYNGHTWYFFRPPGNYVWSVEKGSDGHLYIGGINELGYVIIDSTGNFEYKSLKSYIPDEYQDFTRVWKVVSFDEGLYFRSAEYLFYWDGEKMDVWETDTRFSFIERIGNTLYVWKVDTGLYRMENGSLRLVSGGERFAEHSIRLLLPYDDNRIIIGTRTDGFYLFDGEEYEPWETEAKQFITENTLYRGTVLPDGRFVFGTLQGGAVIVDRNGRIDAILDTSVGLSEQSVLSTYVDRDGMLWLGMQGSVSRVEPMLPITEFDSRVGLEGLILDMKEFQGDMYIGTSWGVYTVNLTNNSQSGFGSFTRHPEVSQAIHNINQVDNKLLVAGQDGVLVLDEDEVRVLYPESVLIMYPSRFDNEVLYFASGSQLNVARYRDGELTVLSEGVRIPEPICMAEGDEGVLYVGTRTNGVYILEWSLPSETGGNTDTVIKNVKNIGLPADFDIVDEVRVFYIAGNIRVGTYKGLYTIDEYNMEYVPDSLLSGRFAGGSGREVYTLTENNKGEIYTGSILTLQSARPSPDGNYTLSEGALRRLAGLRFNTPYNLYADSFGNVWYGGGDQVYVYNSDNNYNHTKEFNAKIDEVFLDTDSLIYRGFLQSSATSNPKVFAYTENNLRFRFSIPAYQDVKENRYQTMLEPVDEEWSRWTDEWFKDYTNLREGHYRFMVRGRDVYGNVSEMATFEFRILPPWYRTWWAYGMSALILWLLLLSAHRYRVNRLLEVERTRTRIARDLHDDIGSNLSSIALMIDMVSNKKSVSDEDKKELSSIGETAREMVESLRDVVWMINPEHDKLGILVERMKSIAGNMLGDIDFSIDTDIMSTRETANLDFKRSVILIYKEALNNIIKHAHATRVSISISESDGMFQMRIEDDGVGFVESENKDGNGLENMRYRAHQINGRLVIHSSPGEGTVIELKAELF